MTELDKYLIVGAALFVLGAIGFLTRRNLIVMMLSAEMMLHGVGINLVAFNYEHQHNQGQSFTIMILTVAACEAGLALVLILSLYKRRKTLDVDVWGELGEAKPLCDVRLERRATVVEPQEEEFSVDPRLTPAGRLPQFNKQESVTRV
ncbi:MAG: NADH-quinone oxidoreductase subunit NuoK [Planctomycetota bacterium]|nr:NADH-quinone oxidoreductase subunit NuoK [Planctomycetota bacterium]MDA1210885.1 NADH-quinone oxidoreductase subunit NuoK [Planctomycetota bacterium]